MGRMTRTVVLASGAVLALALPSGAMAATKTVLAGKPPNWAKLAPKTLGAKFVKQYAPDVNDFFLHRVTIHVGDRVSFVATGPHTVDLPGRSNEDLPFLLPGKPVTGVNDAAGNPFWFNGKVPTFGSNPALVGPSGGTTYNGTTRIDSGRLIGAPKPFNVTFTKAGTYKFFCDVHKGMIGYIVVKPQGTPVPSTKQDATALTAQVKADMAAAKRLAVQKTPRDQVALGAAGGQGVELYAMLPSRLNVKAGTVVRFSMSAKSLDDHTATFGPKPYLTWIANAFVPGGTFQPQPVWTGVYPSEPKQPILLTRTTHGNGFANTGVLDATTCGTFPTTIGCGNPIATRPASRRIKFGQPGVYHFICVFHPWMRGTVTVTK